MPRRPSYPDSTYVKPKRTPLTKPTPGNSAVRPSDRGHEHRRTKQMSNAHGQDGREVRAPERSAATVRTKAASVGTRPADRSAAAGNLRRQHTMRNDTADMMKAVQRPDGSYGAPTNKSGTRPHHTVPAGGAPAGVSRSQKGIATPKRHPGASSPASTAPHHVVPRRPASPEGISHSQKGIATPKRHRVPAAAGQGAGASPAAARPKAQVQTSASGARYVMTPSGKKRYLGKKAR